MYKVAVTREFIANHFLIGGDWGDENKPHAHHYVVEVSIESDTLNKHGYLVDIVDISEKDDSVVFWHCGLAPISMSIKGKAKADIHSNRKKPLLHNFSFKPGVITIFRVSKSANKLKFFVFY